MSVPRCELAPGLWISRIVTGLWQVADMERHGQTLPVETAADAMHRYVDAGLTTFDMADHYGSAEEIAGAFRARPGAGAAVQLLTKWVPAPGPVTRGGARDAVQRALDRLRTDRLDLLQFHAWSFPDPSWLDALFHLQELKQEGLITHLGVTNFDTAHLRIAVASGIDVACNQVCYSLIDQRAASHMTAFCLEHRIRLLAYGTVAGGFLTERWLGRAEPDAGTLDTWPQMKYLRFIHTAGGWDAFQRMLSAVDVVARATGVSIASVASRTILDRPAVCGVIIGARLGEDRHVADNAGLFEFTLDEESRARIAAAMKELQPIPGDCGDEYRKPPFLTASGDLRHHVPSFPAPYAVSTGANGRVRVLSGTPWEEIGGYSRAIRHGDRILVSGTTATHRDRVIGAGDAAAQMHFVIDKLEGALQSLGSRLDDVVRTRIYVRDLEDWEAAARVHGERFRGILPANTLVQASLVGGEYLVEMEAEAVLS